MFGSFFCVYLRRFVELTAMHFKRFQYPNLQRSFLWLFYAGLVLFLLGESRMLPTEQTPALLGQAGNLAHWLGAGLLLLLLVVLPSSETGQRPGYKNSRPGRAGSFSCRSPNYSASAVFAGFITTSMRLSWARISCRTCWTFSLVRALIAASLSASMSRP